MTKTMNYLLQSGGQHRGVKGVVPRRKWQFLLAVLSLAILVPCDSTHSVDDKMLGTDDLWEATFPRNRKNASERIEGQVRGRSGIQKGQGRTEVRKLNRHKRESPPKALERIHKGIYANANEYQYFAEMFERGSSAGCSGALIAQRWILTASHCLSEWEVSRGFHGWRVGWYCPEKDNCNSTFQFVKTDYFVRHPENDEEFAWDIAVVRLEESVVDIEPVLMNDGSYFDLEVGMPTITTMGAGAINDDDDDSKFLSTYPATFVPMKVCIDTFRRQYFAESIVCMASDEGGPCFGDSGSPVVVEGAGEDGEDVLIGPFSFGPGRTCEKGSSPEGAADITLSYQWILDSICPPEMGEESPPPFCEGYTPPPTSPPSPMPSDAPSSHPSTPPSSRPSSGPSELPSSQPSPAPSDEPSSVPSVEPSYDPTTNPTFVPTIEPTLPVPTPEPTIEPTSSPTVPVVSAMPTVTLEMPETRIRNVTSFPWFAEMTVNSKQNEGKGGCAGTLIGEEWIVTAASCIKRKQVRKGKHGWMFGMLCPGCESNTTFFHSRLSKKYWTHPEWSTRQKTWDIALIKLDVPMNETNPVSIWQPGTYNFTEADGVVGLGYDFFKPRDLEEVFTKYMPGSECAAHWNAGYLADNTFCVSGETRGLCQQNGSPILKMGGAPEGAPLLLGFRHYGPLNCDLWQVLPDLAISFEATYNWIRFIACRHGTPGLQTPDFCEGFDPRATDCFQSKKDAYRDDILGKNVKCRKIKKDPKLKEEACFQSGLGLLECPKSCGVCK